ncbi:MAG: serine/threonine-protein kinase, partial [Chloroflexota bacterium]
MKVLGRGGYGAVYQAEHTGLGGALYAIKELYPDLTATLEQQQAASDQFRLEASILAKLNHLTLPTVMDFFNEAGRDYLVMEYVEGETLGERLARTGAPLPEAQVLVWAQELCDVLTYLHTRQPNPVIHRDVKPANIKIAPDGKLKLIDFGIAKIHI